MTFNEKYVLLKESWKKLMLSLGLLISLSITIRMIIPELRLLSSLAWLLGYLIVMLLLLPCVCTGVYLVSPSIWNARAETNQLQVLPNIKMFTFEHFWR